MARAFRCKKCGTGYTTLGKDVPPSPKWADGHVCEMIEVNSYLTSEDKAHSQFLRRSAMMTSKAGVDRL